MILSLEIFLKSVQNFIYLLFCHILTRTPIGTVNMPSQKMRKTRFVCVSDTHNATPGGAFQLPRGDVLIHAGDLTNQGSYSELEKAVKWIEDADFECKIVIAGKF